LRLTSLPFYVWGLPSDARRNGIENGMTSLMGKYVLYRERSERQFGEIKRNNPSAI
jgi:hypothetical protein